MITEPLVFIATSDLGGKVRGKAFPSSDLPRRLDKGVGWTPTNALITCFDTLAESPFGALGDLCLVPDEQAGLEMEFEDGCLTEHLMLGDIIGLDGVPWCCCTRSILKLALERLEDVGGIYLRGAFEHEFEFVTPETALGRAFAWSGFSEKQRFNSALVAMLREVGLTPDTILKEYGANQHEITVAPETGIKAADAAVMLREVVRATARHTGQAVTFAPISDPETVGNGVHIHMSFCDISGEPATYDPSGSGGMSKITASFIAGVLKYLESIIAFTAPSDISYLRLKPHRWSAAFNNLGLCDREAAVRICPITEPTPDKIAQQFNFEFRAADAAASPHLALAAIIHAGAQGIEEALDAPSITQSDISSMSATELEHYGVKRLPASLEDAIQRLQNDQTVRNWFPDLFIDIYAAHKRAEIDYLKDHEMTDRCRIYRQVY